MKKLWVLLFAACFISCREEEETVSFCFATNDAGDIVRVLCDDGTTESECVQLNEDMVEGFNWTYGEEEGCPITSPPGDPG